MVDMVDATLDSPVGRNGLPRWRADTHPGAAIQEAAWHKRDRFTYPEFYNSSRCRFTVFGVEIGGRWAAEAVILIYLVFAMGKYYDLLLSILMYRRKKNIIFMI